LEKVVKAIYWKLNLEGSLKYREPDKQTDVYSTAVAEGIDELAEQLLLRAGERLLGMADDMERVPGAKVGTTKAKYVIYRLEYTQKLKNTVDVRTVPPVVIPVGLFLETLHEINAIKAINKKGVLDGYGIQVSSKKLYLRLLDYIDHYGEAVLFDNEKTFEDWAFEGIEF
jgi:hypothetical protein